MTDYIDRIAEQDAKREKKIRCVPKLNTIQAWHSNNDGSDYCASASMAGIFEAYEEYKNFGNW